MIQFENITELFAPDFDALRAHVRQLEATLPKAGGEMFNGWSVMSRSGSYRDGWVDGSVFMKTLSNGKVYFDSLGAARAGYHRSSEHLTFTEAASDELRRLIGQATELGFQPCRARLIQLVPGAASNWHTDGSPAKTILRLHIVIETNEQAHFHSEEKATHLPANNVFLINVNYRHMVDNLGDTARTHLVVDVKDTKGVSKVHR